MVNIAGKVTEAGSGASVENATVVLGKDFALTGESGGYTMTDLKPGTYTLIVVQRYYQKFEDTVTFSEDSIIDIALQRE
jgi:hypothetical protein